MLRNISCPGLTFVTVLLLLGIAGGVYWVATFGSAYWENQEVKSTLKEAANLCYHERNDNTVRDFIVRKLHAQFDVPGPPNRPPVMAIDFGACLHALSDVVINRPPPLRHVAVPS